MEELGFGPNGGLIYCFEYLLQNMDWLDEELGDYDSDYIIIDCPGQIELYTHHPLLPTLMSHMSRLGIRLCGVYLLDSQFMEDRYKYFSGVMSAMSSMVNFSVPWINIMSKMDLVSGDARNGVKGRRDVARQVLHNQSQPSTTEQQNPRFHHLNEAIVQLVGKYSVVSSRELTHSLWQIEDHPLVSFLPLNLSSTRSLEAVLSHIDYTMQYGEDEEPREPKDMDHGDFADMEQV
ncbi:ATP binding protein [Ceratobasidium sp. 414]|nr:ATP binding protein [Ceratobasidium sp. 414]